MTAMFAENAGAYAAGKARSAARSASTARLPLGDRSYQPVILAEYLIAVVVIVLTPIATGGSDAAQAKNSPSPYDTGDLRQLVAASAVYFILSLASSGNRGRISAWLGGLVLIVLLMARLKGGNLQAVVGTITGTNQTTEGGGGGGGKDLAQ